MEQMIQYIVDAGKPDAVIARALNLRATGYLRQDELTDILFRLDSPEFEVGRWLAGAEVEGMGEFEDIDDDVLDTDEDGTPRLRLILSRELVERHKPRFMESIWQTKTAVDNTFESYQRPGLGGVAYVLQVLEEYGFVDNGEFIVARTQQPIELYAGVTTAPCRFFLPHMDDARFYATIPNRPALGGGVVFEGSFDCISSLASAKPTFTMDMVPVPGFGEYAKFIDLGL